MQLSDGPWFDSGWPDFSTHAAKDANWNTQVVYLPCKAFLVFQIYVSMYGMYVTSISERFLIYCLRFQTNKMRNFGRSEEQFWQDTSYGIAVCNGVCVWHQHPSTISETSRKNARFRHFFGGAEDMLWHQSLQVNLWIASDIIEDLAHVWKKTHEFIEIVHAWILWSLTL